MKSCFRLVWIFTWMAAAVGGWAQSAAESTPANPTVPNASRTPSARLAGSGPVAGLDVRIISVLTPEQRVSLQSISQARRSQTAQIEQRLRAARKDLAEVGLTGKFDEKDIRQKAKTLGDAEAELAILRAKTISEIKPPLSDEQIQKMKSPMRLMPRDPSQLQKEKSSGPRLLSPSATNSVLTNKVP